jgi:peptide/nickel transport system permease protein
MTTSYAERSGPVDPADVDELLSPEAEAKPRTQWQLFRRRFRKHVLAMVSLVVLTLIVLACLFPGVLTPFERGHQDLKLAGQSYSTKHWLGTDRTGRDVMTEVLYSGRVTLVVGLAVALFSTVIGALLGAWAGYVRGRVDQIFSRITDLFLVIPGLLIAAVAMSYVEEKDKFLFWDVGTQIPGTPIEVSRAFALVVVLTFLGWMYIFRIVRGQVLSIREKEFVEAARAAGATSRRIIFRHILPNSIGVIVVNATLAIAVAITLEATLSYLGFGLKPPDVSWGYMIYDARGTVGTNMSHLLYSPALMLFLVVLAVNFIGDGLRDAFEPRSKQEH